MCHIQKDYIGKAPHVLCPSDDITHMTMLFFNVGTSHPEIWCVVIVVIVVIVVAL